MTALRPARRDRLAVELDGQPGGRCRSTRSSAPVSARASSSTGLASAPSGVSFGAARRSPRGGGTLRQRDASTAGTRLAARAEGVPAPAREDALALLTRRESSTTTRLAAARPGARAARLGRRRNPARLEQRGIGRERVRQRRTRARARGGPRSPHRRGPRTIPRSAAHLARRGSRRTDRDLFRGPVADATAEGYDRLSSPDIFPA